MSSRLPSDARRAPVVPAVVLVLLAAASVALTRPGPDRPDPVRPPASGALVTRTQLGCPDPPPVGGVATSVRAGLVAAPGLPAGGVVEVGPPAGGVSGAGSKPVLARGRLTRLPAAAGVAVRATGPPASGLFGFRTDRTGTATTGGTLAVASCLAPRALWWFTGAGAGLDHSSTLVVANLDPGPAVVDLRVLGPDGEVDTVATTGIVVAPRSQRRIPLVGVAPQTADLALEVHARRGRVVASVSDTSRAQPGARPGQDRVPGTEEASRTLTLAGVPAAGPGGGGTSSGAKPGRGTAAGRTVGRTLLVANPSELEAIVTLSVSGRSGTYTPTGVGEVTVAPGAVRTVDLADALRSSGPVAVRLGSTEPVVASLRSTRDGDHAYAAAVTPLTGPAAAPLVRGARAGVQLTAGSAGARVQATAYDAQGRRAGGRTISIPPTATVAWSPTAAAGYVVVTPLGARGEGQAGGSGGGSGGVSGGVRGAVSYAGDGLAAVPLVSVPFRETRPHVEPGLR